MKKYFTTNQIRKAMALVLALVLLVAAVPFGARKAHAAVYYSTIRVNVVSARGESEGIDGAKVEISGEGVGTYQTGNTESFSLFTDGETAEETTTEGRAVFNVAADGIGKTVLINVSAAGYKSISVPENECPKSTSTGMNPSEVTVKLEADPNTAYYVRVMDGSAAISGAKVTVSVNGKSYAGTTSETGYAYFPEINLLTGEGSKEISITAEKFGYDLLNETETITIGSVEGTGKEVSLSKADLNLIVKDLNGAVSGVIVQLYCDDTGAATFDKVTTNTEGKASVQDFYLNALGHTYFFTVRAGETTQYSTNPESITVTEGMATGEMTLNVTKKRPSKPSFPSTPQHTTFNPSNKTFSLQPSGEIFDTDTIRYFISGGDAGVAEIDEETGVVSYVKAGHVGVFATISNSIEAYEDCMIGYQSSISVKSLPFRS